MIFVGTVIWKWGQILGAFLLLTNNIYTHTYVFLPNSDDSISIIIFLYK